jgi:hypothetical protein
VPGLRIDNDLCQEDWGVVYFTERNQKRFWIGIGSWDEGAWIAHVHHRSFAWLQRVSPSGNDGLNRLLGDLHDTLASDQAVSEIKWYEEREMLKPRPIGFPRPN